MMGLQLMLLLVRAHAHQFQTDQLGILRYYV